MQRFWFYLFLSIFPLAALSASANYNINAPAGSKCIYTKGPFVAYRGSQGDRGKRGPDGKKGPRGKKGKVGKFGPRGRPGFRGLQGPCGTIGYEGQQGEIGNEGDIGLQGLTGPAGNAGSKGAHGTTTGFFIDPISPVIWDEFFSGNLTSTKIGSLGWTLESGTLSLTPPPGPLNNHPGVIELIGATGASENTFDAELQLSTSSGSVYLPDPFDMKMFVRVNTDAETKFGFFSIDNASFISFSTQITPGFWSVEWNNGTLKNQPTNVPVTSDWVELRISRPNQNGDVHFYINNVFVFTILAFDVPTGALNVKVGSKASLTEGAAVDIDYISIRWPHLNR